MFKLLLFNTNFHYLVLLYLNAERLSSLILKSHKILLAFLKFFRNIVDYNLDILPSKSINNGKIEKKNHCSKTIPTGVNYPESMPIIVITRSRNQAKLRYKKNLR